MIDDLTLARAPHRADGRDRGRLSSWPLTYTPVLVARSSAKRIGASAIVSAPKPSKRLAQNYEHEWILTYELRIGETCDPEDEEEVGFDYKVSVPSFLLL